MTAYRLLAALIGWAAVGLQYWLLIQGQPPSEVGPRTVNFFSYFTILTNILVAVGFTAPALAPTSGLGRLMAGANVRASMLVYIAVVGSIYYVVLRHLWSPTGLQLWVDIALHYVTPVLMLIDWLAFSPKAGLRWSGPIRWLAYPVVYAAWTLAHGAMTGWYPYPFSDAAKLGYPQVLLNFSGMMVLFALAGAIVVFVGKLMAGSGASRPAAAQP